MSRTIDFTVSDKHSVEKFVTEVLSGFKLIDKSSHKGIRKVWILQNMLIPSLCWPLLIYKISFSVVNCIERKISSLLRKWLNIHHSTTNIRLYSSSSPCPLPLKSLTSILHSTKVSGHLLLKEAADKQISESASQLKCGFWNVTEAVVDPESRLEFQKVIGYHQTSRAGFESFKSSFIPRRNSHEYRSLISDLVGEVNEHAYHAKSVQLHLQGYWCDFVKNDLSWKTLLAMPSSLISFCLGATFDTLPSPSNLKRWRLITESSCFLWGKSICTSAHILGACKIALQEDHFSFRHNKVHNKVIVKNFLSSYKPNKYSVINFINFVKEGKKPKTAPDKGFLGIRHSASDWNLEFDLDGMLVVPVFLAVSTLRPNILIFWRSTEKVIIIGLACPCEENMSQWHKEKSQKYYPLCCSIRSNGWSVYFYAIEVGAQGFCAESVRSYLHCVGFSNRLCRKSLQTLSSVSLRCSFEIWLCRNSNSWSLPHLVSMSNSELTQKMSNLNGVSAHDDHHVCAPVYSVPSLNTANKHCRIINKGNTCYANVILQYLKVFPVFWSPMIKLNQLCILQLEK